MIFQKYQWIPGQDRAEITLVLIKSEKGKRLGGILLKIEKEIPLKKKDNNAFVFSLDVALFAVVVIVVALIIIVVVIIVVLIILVSVAVIVIVLIIPVL